MHLDGPGVERFLEGTEPPPSSLGNCLVEMFGKYQDHVVQINAATGEVLKYKDVLAEALALAAGLRSFGVTPGKLIGLLAAPNDPKVITILVASLILGAVLYPIDPIHKSSDTKLTTLLDKGPRIVFCGAEYVSTVKDLKSEKTTIVSTDVKLKSEVNHPLEGVFYFESILNGEEGIVDLIDLGPRDVLVVLQGERSHEDIVLTNETLLKYSSRRKQARNELGQGQILDYEDWSSPSWIIRRLFMFRSGGGTLTVVPPYEPENTLALVQKYRVTWVALKSTEIIRLYDCHAIVGYDLSSLQMVSAPSSESSLHTPGGAKLDSLRERLPATRVVITGKSVLDAIPV